MDTLIVLVYFNLRREDNLSKDNVPGPSMFFIQSSTRTIIINGLSMLVCIIYVCVLVCMYVCMYVCVCVGRKQNLLYLLEMQLQLFRFGYQ